MTGFKMQPVKAEDADQTGHFSTYGMRALDNPSGINPTEFKVLIEPKPVEEKVGNIIIPDTTLESEKYKATEGRIVAISHLAFTYATPEEWGEKKPKAGDRVLHAKYAGVRVKGADEKEYLLVNDKDICAIIEE